MKAIHPVHPFPARMSPDVALSHVSSFAPGSLVLDPMAGSGTVLRMASEQGHHGLGFDTDPLSVLMARVWTTPLDTGRMINLASRLVHAAKRIQEDSIHVDWIDADPPTKLFVNYWFGQRQQSDLRRLGSLLFNMQGTVSDALRIALSRIIITKDRGASLARDVSHSRPHRVKMDNDFPVMEEFLRSVRRLAQRLRDQPPPGRVRIDLGDARKLSGIESASIDGIITSPPYLNAIDYMRGHRLALVWLGYRVRELRTVRSDGIGAERRPEVGADLRLAADLKAVFGPLDRLAGTEERMVDRYVLDLHAAIEELHRVLRPGGTAVFVVGNSCIRGTFIKNSAVVTASASRVGLRLLSESERDLPPNRRYLPPPGDPMSSDLRKRMRTETVLAFCQP